MVDLERLKQVAGEIRYSDIPDGEDVVMDAADEIERLRAEVERLTPKPPAQYPPPNGWIGKGDAEARMTEAVRAVNRCADILRELRIQMRSVAGRD